MFTPRLCNLFVISAASLLAGAGCHRFGGPVPVDPGVTFAAHRERGGLAIDRLKGGGPGTLQAPGWLRAPDAPTYLLRTDGETRAALWAFGRSRVLVRREPSTHAESLGEVTASWEDGAIRLTLYLPAGTSFHTDAFTREGGGTGPGTLSRTAQTVLDVRGTYRAAVHNGSGAAAGWLRVRVSPYQEAARIYDGVLPPEIDDGLAAAAAVAIDTEVTWVEDHALDVYRGTGGGPLERSIPSGR